MQSRRASVFFILLENLFAQADIFYYIRHMSLKCIVIDDQQYAIDAMVRYIHEMPNMEVLATFSDSLVALDEVRKGEDVDFIFLDIEMPHLTGLELAKSLRSKTRFLVFTTSHERHALDAFELQANQYLLKPITFAKFAIAVTDLLKHQSITAASISPKFQFIKAEYKNTYHYINPTEILYIQAAKNYVVIVLEKEQFVTHLGLNALEGALSTKDFIRVSKSFIIAKHAIRKIEGNSIKLKNDHVVQVGRTYKPTFVNFVKESMI